MIFKRLCLVAALCGAAAGVAAAPAAAVAPAASTVAPAASAVAPAASTAVQVPIPFKHEGSSPAGSLSGAAGVLLVSVAAIVAVLVIRRRLRLDGPSGGAPRLLRVLETQRLGPRTLLSVVEFGGRQHLIAQSEQGVQCLATADQASAPGTPS
jgi:flagellar biogenesis protein FliO